MYFLQNKTEVSDFDNRQFFCIKGCTDASNAFFGFIRSEFPVLAAPALVADSLTSSALSLEWSVPEKFYELVQSRRIDFKDYFVQCNEYPEIDWKICGNQTIYENSTIHLEALQPYTKYKVKLLRFAVSSLNDSHIQFLYCSVSSSSIAIWEWSHLLIAERCDQHVRRRRAGITADHHEHQSEWPDENLRVLEAWN